MSVPSVSAEEMVLDVLWNENTDWDWVQGTMYSAWYSTSGYTFIMKTTVMEVETGRYFKGIVCDRFQLSECLGSSQVYEPRSLNDNRYGITVKLSDIGTKNLLIVRPFEVTVPTIVPDSGEFDDFLEVKVIATVPSGCSLYYSLDGSDPSVVIGSGVSIKITDTSTVKAKMKCGSTSSPVVTKVYTKKVYQPLSLQFTPDDTYISKPIDVSLIPSESDAIIYYSLDGTEPTIPYKSSIRIENPVTLRAKAVKGSRSSPVYERVYQYPPIRHTDDTFFQIPVDLPLVVKGSKDLISVASPGVWLFAVAFFGLLILGFVKKVYKR